MAALHALAQSLKTGEGCMSFIVMVNGRIESEGAQCAYAAYTEQDFLLETVLPVTSVELVGHLPVFRNIGFEVGVEQIEVCPSHGNLPDAGCHIPSRKSNLDGLPYSVLVNYRLGRNLEEVLGLILRNLISLRSKPLGEVSIPVEESDSNEVHVHIAGLLEVVSGKNAETA